MIASVDRLALVVVVAGMARKSWCNRAASVASRKACSALRAAAKAEPTASVASRKARSALRAAAKAHPAAARPTDSNAALAARSLLRLRDLRPGAAGSMSSAELPRGTAEPATRARCAKMATEDGMNKM